MQANDLVGVWIIQSFVMENLATGERLRPWGEKPGGTVIFHHDGRMFAIITPDGRSSPSTESEQAMTYRDMLAYSGHFRIDPPATLVTTVDIAWHQPWVGSQQVRYCQLDGDDLTLTSAPLAMPEKDGKPETVFAVVKWKRENALR